MKKLVLILGMHRSGTSTLTGVLNKMGLPIGEPLLPPTEDNPKGYFENFNFVRANEIILQRCGSTWDEVDNVFDDRKLITEENKDLLKILFKHYNKYEIFGLKDPRICVLLPLYVKVCEELNIEIIYFNIERDVDSVTKSLFKRDGFSLEKIQKLIGQHKVRIKTKDYFIKYEDLIDNTEKVINDLNSSFNFLNLKNRDEILDFVDPKLNRNN